MAKNKFRKSNENKAHQPNFPGYQENAGTKNDKLVEPVPEFFSRSGDMVINAKMAGGTDNNTAIIFGRDRTGRGEVDNKDPAKKNELGEGSYGDYQAAGAIDIVVGRCAPFPIQKTGFTMGPLFNTAYGNSTLTGTPLGEIKPAGEAPPMHEGYAMDAARIYISQMTNVDDNFKLAPVTDAELAKLSLSAHGIKTPLGPPSSAITLKSDKIRLHAREDLKIVTGGPHETKNSQGEPIMNRGGIHLVAQNEVGNQQPIPLGDNLVKCILELIETFNSLSTAIGKFALEQMEYNQSLVMHNHHSPMQGIKTTFSLEQAPVGTKTVMNTFKNVLVECQKANSNLQHIRAEYLIPDPDPEDEGNYYINSPYNTTN